MVNYAGNVDLNSEEPPDLPPVEYTDADAPDFGPPPDFIPDTFVPFEAPEWDEPPAEYLPPAYVVDMPDAVLEALRESGWQEEVAPIQPQLMSFLDEALVPEAVGIPAVSSTLDADLADVQAQLERLEANEDPIDHAAQQDLLLEQQSQREQELDDIASPAPVFDVEETGEAAPNISEPSSPDAARPEDDPRAALDADLADVQAQLERLEANENPMERFFERDALLERQALLEEELNGLTNPAVDVQGVDVQAILESSAVNSAALDQPGIMPLDTLGQAAPPDPDLDNVEAAAPVDNVQFLTFGDSGPSFNETPDLEALASVENSLLWDQYSTAVMEGQNPGGGELALVQRAEEMNLLDARFVGYSAADGHHVGAVELAVDPATGQEYGQILDVATFEDVNQAAALYYDLEGHALDNGLPNYAVADFAAFSALALGNDLAWQQATEQQLALVYERVAIMPSDEPPTLLMDTLIQEYAGVDLSGYAQESAFEYENEPAGPGLDEQLDSPDLWDGSLADEPPLSPEEETAFYEQAQMLPTDEPPEESFEPLIQEYAGVDLSSYPGDPLGRTGSQPTLTTEAHSDPIGAQESAFEYEPAPENTVQYNVYLDSNTEGKTSLGLSKEWEGGPRAGGGEAYRLVSVYENLQVAQAVAQDLVNLRQDVERLTGDAVAGYQAMASMAYEIGLAAEVIQPGDALFVDQPSDAPPDPFEVQPTEELFAEYAAMQQELEVDAELEQHADGDIERGGPDLDL